MRNLPSLKQLEYFVALADSHSFSSAAESVGISQPSLSIQLANLEKRCGQVLVERNRHGPILTPAGREVLVRARGILTEVRNLMDHFDAAQSGSSSKVRFGVSATLGPYLLPHVVARLQTHMPDLNLYIREGTPEALVKGLKCGDFDVILLQFPVRGEFETIRMFREPLELVVARDHPFVEQRRVPRSALEGATVLSLGPAYVLHQQVVELCERLGARISSDYEGDSLDAIRLMVGMGMGVAFMPNLYVRAKIGTEDPDVVTVPIEGPRLSRSIGIARRAGSLRETLPHLIKAINAVTREVFTGIIIPDVG